MSNGIKNYTKTGRIQRPPYNLIAQWIHDAWYKVDTLLIQKSFKVCGISNSQDGKEDQLIFDYEQVGLRKQESCIIFNLNNDNGEGSSGNEENSIDLFLNLEQDIENNQENEYYETNQLNYINDW